jgi:hypothetical protein
MKKDKIREFLNSKEYKELSNDIKSMISDILGSYAGEVEMYGIEQAEKYILNEINDLLFK